ILLNVGRGTDPARVRDTLRQQLGQRATFLISTPFEQKADLRAQLNAGVGAFFVLLLLAGLVGLFGLANTMAVSVMQRYREIGLLRAVGARRRQITGMALVEAETLVAVAFVLAIPLGVLISRPLLATISSGIGDFTL